MSCHARCLLYVLPLLQPFVVCADNDAGDYTQFPDGTNSAVFYYEHTRGDKLHAGGRHVASDYNFGLDIGVLKLATYRELAGNLYVFQLGVYHADAELEQPSTGIDLQASGMGDPVFLAGFWPYSNKAAGIQWGVSGWATMPLGSYDHNNPMNIGNNRWVFKPETNLTFTLADGLTLEAAGSVEFFTDNHSFGPDNQTLSREPSWNLEGHISKQVNKTLNLSLDYFHHNGGESAVAGNRLPDARNDHSLQTSAAFPLADNLFMRLIYRDNFIVENGPETRTVGFRLIKIF